MVGAGESVISGKLSIADVAILRIFILCNDSLIRAERELERIVPTVLTIVRHLQQNPHYARVIEDAKAFKYIF